MFLRLSHSFPANPEPCKAEGSRGAMSRYLRTCKVRMSIEASSFDRRVRIVVDA